MAIIFLMSFSFGLSANSMADRPLKGANKSKFQYYVIDGMVYSSNIEMSYCKTVDLGFKNSDHNPVVAEIKLK